MKGIKKVKPTVIKGNKRILPICKFIKSMPYGKLSSFYEKIEDAKSLNSVKGLSSTVSHTLS